MIPQMEPRIGNEEAMAAWFYVQSGGWLTEYKYTREMEKMIASYVRSRHCIMMPSGTLALYAALMALRIGPGNAVLVPDFTMIATANAVRMAGAQPLFVDIRKEHLCMDLPEVGVVPQHSLSEPIVAAIVVSLNGRAPDMSRTCRWAARNNIWLIEDACQSLGSTQRGNYIGTWGEMGVFSFSSQKIVTTGNGGCIVTDNDELAHRLRLFKDFGREEGGADEYLGFGINLKFTDLQAVVGLEQLKKLHWRVNHRREMYRRYRYLLKDVSQVEFVPTDLAQTVPWFIDLLVEDREALIEFLADRGIGSRPFYPPLHQTFYQQAGDFPVSEYVSAHGLWLPSSSKLTDGDIDKVCRGVKEFYGC